MYRYKTKGFGGTSIFPFRISKRLTKQYFQDGRHGGRGGGSRGAILNSSVAAHWVSDQQVLGSIPGSCGMFHITAHHISPGGLSVRFIRTCAQKWSGTINWNPLTILTIIFMWTGGGTGFLGQHLSRLLKSKGYEVIAVSRTPGAGRITWVSIDFLDYSL